MVSVPVLGSDQLMRLQSFRFEFKTNFVKLKVIKVDFPACRGEDAGPGPSTGMQGCPGHCGGGALGFAGAGERRQALAADRRWERV
jgi:hypothetical protein